MVLARIGLAAGEAGAGPASNSLLTDIFPPERRNARHLGRIGSQFHWARRWSGAGRLVVDLLRVGALFFLILGLPGVLLGLLVWFLSVEPRRGKGAIVAAPKQSSMKEVLSTMAGNTSLRWVGLLLTMVPITGLCPHHLGGILLPARPRDVQG